jgi:hypothetical protein
MKIGKIKNTKEEKGKPGQKNGKDCEMGEKKD